MGNVDLMIDKAPEIPILSFPRKRESSALAFVAI
jgi:hypothetical protein